MAKFEQIAESIITHIKLFFFKAKMWGYQQILNYSIQKRDKLEMVHSTMAENKDKEITKRISVHEENREKKISERKKFYDSKIKNSIADAVSEKKAVYFSKSAWHKQDLDFARPDLERSREHTKKLLNEKKVLLANKGSIRAERSNSVKQPMEERKRAREMENELELNIQQKELEIQNASLAEKEKEDRCNRVREDYNQQYNEDNSEWNRVEANIRKEITNKKNQIHNAECEQDVTATRNEFQIKINAVPSEVQKEIADVKMKLEEKILNIKQYNDKIQLCKKKIERLEKK